MSFRAVKEDKTKRHRSRSETIRPYVRLAISLRDLILVVLVFWLAVIITGFGLFVPYNGTVIATLSLCTLSV